MPAKAKTPEAALLKRLSERGLDGYELCRIARTHYEVEAKEGRVDALTSATTQGWALRVIKNGALGFSYSADASAPALEEMTEAAMLAAQAAGPDPYLHFPEPTAMTDIPPLTDPRGDELSPEKRGELALAIESAALAYDPRVVKVHKVAWSEEHLEMNVYNHKGLEASGRATLYEAAAAVLASDGQDQQIGYDFVFDRAWDRVPVQIVGQEAARRALELIGAGPMETVSCPAVLDNLVTAQFLKVLSHAFMLEQVDKGKSLLAGKIGEPVFSPRLTISDNGLLPGGYATFPFDGEGSAQADTHLVREGRLLGFLADGYYARKCGAPATGNSRRTDFRRPPGTDISNFYIHPGSASQADLVGSLDFGVLLVEVMGVHTADPVSGDFSLGAAGFVVERGHKIRPVKGFMVSGKVGELFRRVAEVGEDLKFWGSVGAPSLLIDKIEISGSAA